MSICLSHESALRYWLTKTGDECIPNCSERTTLAWASANMSEIKGAYLPFDYSEDVPLHVLVPDRASQRHLKSVVTHVWKAGLPSGSLFELSGKTFERFEAFIWMVRERFGIEQRTITASERAAQKDLYAHLTDPEARLFRGTKPTGMTQCSYRRQFLEDA